MSNGYKLLKLFYDYCSQQALPSKLADFWARKKKKKQAAPCVPKFAVMDSLILGRKGQSRFCCHARYAEKNYHLHV